MDALSGLSGSVGGIGGCAFEGMEFFLLLKITKNWLKMSDQRFTSPNLAPPEQRREILVSQKNSHGLNSPLHLQPNMTDDIKIIHFAGWHGTDEKNAGEILEINFKESPGDEHWLGEGVYFFTNGLGNPLEHAQNWAISEAHKKKNTRFAVLQADIAVNDSAILDLRQDKGLELFNAHRALVLGKIRKTGRRFSNSSEEYCDGKVLEHMKQVGDLDVVIANMYVRFLQDRVEKIRSLIPNCTFLCVSNPVENVTRETIKIVRRGNV